MRYGYYASDTVANPKPIKYNDVYKHDYKKSDSNDMVNHPKHYKAKNGLETIDVIDAFTENLEGYEAAYTANILKYVCRWKEKNGVEDLKKAQWYLNRLIDRIENPKPEPRTTALHWYSWTNDNMDFVVFVSSEYENLFTKAINNTMDHWFETGINLPYGDYLESMLDLYGIRYQIIHYDDDPNWSEYINFLIESCPCIYVHINK